MWTVTLPSTVFLGFYLRIFVVVGLIKSLNRVSTLELLVRVQTTLQDPPISQSRFSRFTHHPRPFSFQGILFVSTRQRSHIESSLQWFLLFPRHYVSFGRGPDHLQFSSSTPLFLRPTFPFPPITGRDKQTTNENNSWVLLFRDLICTRDWRRTFIVSLLDLLLYVNLPGHREVNNKKVTFWDLILELLFLIGRFLF